MLIRLVAEGVVQHYCSQCAADEGIDTTEGYWVRGGWCAACGHVDSRTGPLHCREAGAPVTMLMPALQEKGE